MSAAPPSATPSFLPTAPLCAARRRRLRVALMAAIVSVASGCMTLERGDPGPAIEAAGTAKPGSELTYLIRNGYNGELRATAMRRFDEAGSRFEGLAYEEAGSGGFGRQEAALVAQHFDARGDLVAWERADGRRTTFEPPLRALPFPLVPGQSVRQDVLARVDGEPRLRRVVMIARVGGWETVDVPAGRYRALRVTRDLWLGDFEFHRTETRRIEIDWYSPEAGAVVRSSEDSAHIDLLMGRGRFGGGIERRGDWLIRELDAPVNLKPGLSSGWPRNPSGSPHG